MDLEKLQELADSDLKINDTELDLESLKTPQLHNKYLKLLSKFNLLLKKADSDYAILHRNKWEYYMGKSDPIVYKEKPFDLKILPILPIVVVLPTPLTPETKIILSFSILLKKLSFSSGFINSII